MAEQWPAPRTAPPPGRVQLTGILRSSEEGRFVPRRPRPGGPLTVGAVDLAGLSRELSQPLYPLYVQLDPEAATTSSYPVPVEPPPLDEGPHLSYALQWFTFAAGAAVGWLILVRQSAKAPTGDRGGGDSRAAVPHHFPSLEHSKP